MNSRRPVDESPSEKCARLVVALEDLASQEAVCLKSRDFAAVLSIQGRVEPIIGYLSQHAADVDPAVRDRIAVVLKLRHESGEWLAEELGKTRAELDALEAKKRRVAVVAPVYGKGPVPRSRLNIKG